MSDQTTARYFAPIDANPYAWPFDGNWSQSNTALLLLGFQTQAVIDLDAAPQLQIATGVLELAAERSLCVVASRRGSVDEQSVIARRRRALGDSIHPAGSSAWMLAAQLRLPPTAIIVDHAGDNAFFSTDLEDQLKNRGVRNLLIAGLPTDGLVHATQRAANDMGFECLTLSDACKGTDENRHIAQLRITTFGNGLFGAVATAGAVCAAISEH
jgi:nicotinamidase-related amidase